MITLNGSLAQLGERYPYKVDVIGSSPITSTIQEYGVNGSMSVSKTVGVGSNPTTPAI
jgi:hypothetical protein